MTRENPFKNLSSDQRELIEKAYESGQSPEEIGIKFELDFDDVRFYCENFITPPKSRYERLQEIVSDLESTTEQCRHRIDSGSQDSAMMIQSYQRLMSEYRVALAELDEVKTPTDVVEDIVKKVLNPFVIGIAKVSTEETKKLQEELIKLNVPSRDAKGMSEEIFRRLMANVKTNLVDAERALNGYYGIKSKKNDDIMGGIR
tara:strand:+ start:47 stop:652 length:606 start_codon:yes stop_codon:yes gene_type:complete